MFSFVLASSMYTSRISIYKKWCSKPLQHCLCYILCYFSFIRVLIFLGFLLLSKHNKWKHHLYLTITHRAFRNGRVSKVRLEDVGQHSVWKSRKKVAWLSRLFSLDFQPLWHYGSSSWGKTRRLYHIITREMPGKRNWESFFLSLLLEGKQENIRLGAPEKKL